MAKQKRVKLTRMDEHAHNNPDGLGAKTKGNLVLPGVQTRNSPLDVSKNMLSGDFDTIVADRKAYNDSLWSSVDSRYRDFEPVRRMVVRMFVMEPSYSEGGLFLGSDRLVPVPTQSGHGFLPPARSAWPYSSYGVIVNVPSMWRDRFSPGQYCVVSKAAVVAKVFSKETPQHLPNGFTLPPYYDPEPPTNIKDVDYGYLLIDPNTELIGVMSENPHAAVK